MVDQNIPDKEVTQTKLAVARLYIERGWPVFVLGQSKTPVKNCPRCDAQRPGYVPHDREACECLTCHGFYAATLQIDGVREMLRHRSDGMLAIRTGEASQLMIIDAESSASERAGDGLTGLDVLDDWEGWTGHELIPSLRQRTGSGGIHVAYLIPSGRSVGSHNRILPQVDVKANGGYIAAYSGGHGCDDGRTWLGVYEDVVEAPATLLDWLESRRGRSSGNTGSGGNGWGNRWGTGGQLLGEDDYARCLREGASAGEREPFFAMLIFKLFKSGKKRREVEEIVRAHWERCEQTPGDEFAWASIEYKLNRDEHGVVATPPLDERLRNWVENLRRQPDDTSEHGQVKIEGQHEQVRQVGRVTLVRRP